MNVNHNKIHSGCDIHDQVYSLHHFIHCVVRGLPPSNHDGKLTHGTAGELVFEGADHERNPFIHQAVEVGGLPRHFLHHANLKKKKNQCQGHEKKKKIQHPFFFSHSPRVGDHRSGGSGGSHVFGRRAVASPLGSTHSSLLGLWDTPSGHIWAVF